ncbi:MAG TPA: S1C family serine protease, partial [Thermodesulfobacteriota bacterium]
GVVVTAEHTLRRDDDLSVTLPDGSTVPATLAGRDPGADLAALRVDTASAPALTTAEPPAAGSVVLTVGRSPDSGPNATMGIVSAVSGEWRTWRGGRLDHYIRLDLTLYPGSSGGVVVDFDGRAVGIATSVLSRIAGLAIPASNVDRTVDELLARGHVARGYLGLGLQPVELPDHRKGLIVVSLESGGPAAKAGVIIGDVLLSIGGRPAHDTDDLAGVLEANRVGSPVEAEVLRGGESRKLAIVIGERPRRS